MDVGFWIAGVGARHELNLVQQLRCHSRRVLAAWCNSRDVTIAVSLPLGATAADCDVLKAIAYIFM